MGSRRKARECALQLLYQVDVGGGRVADALGTYWTTQEADDDVRQFASFLVDRVVKNLSEIGGGSGGGGVTMKLVSVTDTLITTVEGAAVTVGYNFTSVY